MQGQTHGLGAPAMNIEIAEFELGHGLDNQNLSLSLPTILVCWGQAGELRAFVFVVACQHEAAMDTRGGHEFRQQRSRKLNRDAIGALNQDLLDRPSVVVEVFLIRQVELEFERFQDRGLD